MSYDSTILAQSPLAYLELEETSGTTAADATGNGHAGTYSASNVTLGVTGIPGVAGSKAVTFANTGNVHLSLPALSATSGGDFGVGCWVKTTLADGQVHVLVGSDEVGYFLALNGNVAQAVANATVTGTTAINDGQWHYVFAARRSGTLSLYVDGASQGTPITSSQIVTTGNHAVGAYNASGAFGLVGTITRAEFYAGNPPAPSAIAANYTAGITPPVVPGITLPVTAGLFSPGNWVGDAGRGGSVSRTTWNVGAWCQFNWTTTSGSPTATLKVTNPTASSTIAYVCNGKVYDNVAVPTNANGVAISNVQTGANSLTVYCRSSTSDAGRWGLTNAFVVTGVTVDTSATAAAAPAARPWALIVGDSITEGVAANAGADSFLSSYTYGLARALDRLGYDTGVSACGWEGWIRPGDSTGDVPAYYSVSAGVYSAAASRWSRIASGVSLLDTGGHVSAYGGIGQEPAVIFCNLGTNEELSSSSISDTQMSVQGALAALRAAAPNAWIIAAVPFGLYNTTVFPNGPTYAAAIKSAVAGYQSGSGGDARTVPLDLGTAAADALASPLYGAAVHPLAAGHAFLAPQVAEFVVAKLTSSATTTSNTGGSPIGQTTFQIATQTGTPPVKTDLPGLASVTMVDGVTVVGTGAVVVAAGTAMTRTGTGTYTGPTITDATPGLVYQWTARFTFADGSHKDSPEVTRGSTAAVAAVPDGYPATPASALFLAQKTLLALMTAAAANPGGVARVNVDGQEVQYNSAADLNAAISFWERKVALLSGKRRRTFGIRLDRSF